MLTNSWLVFQVYLHYRLRSCCFVRLIYRSKEKSFGKRQQREKTSHAMFIRRTALVVISLLVIFLILLTVLPWRPNNRHFPVESIKQFVTTQKPFHNFIDPDDIRIIESFSSHKRENKSVITGGKTIPRIYIYKTKLIKRRSECVRLETPTGFTPICIYDVKTDSLMSSFIKDHRTWESDYVNVMNQVLQKYPDVHLLDIGCSIGVYTLNAAKMGRQVVAVDALKSNMELLYSSLVYGKLKRNVTLVWNALSDVRKLVSVKVGKNNIGGSHVDHEPLIEKKLSFLYTSPTVDAVFLDDLTELVSSKMHKVYMKIDSEGSEAKILRKSSTFFQSLDVRYIQMEWTFQRNKDGLEILQFLTSYGFLPYSGLGLKKVLDPSQYGRWPDDILWIKR